MRNEEKLFRIKKDFIYVLKENQSIPLFINDDLNMSCYENYVRTTKKFTNVIKEITNAIDIEELIQSIKKSQNNQEVIKVMINNTHLLNEIWYLNRYKNYKNENTILFNWIESYLERKKLQNFDIGIISKKIFDRLYIIKNKYGFSNIQINFDFNKNSESFCLMLEKVCLKLCNYLGLKQDEYNKIGEGLILNLSSYDKNSLNRKLGEFRYFNLQTDKIILDSILTLNFYPKKTSKNSLFKTFLHEYVHFMDYKLGNKIIRKVRETSVANKKNLFSELEDANKNILPFIKNNVSIIINENLNNSHIIEDLKLIINKDADFLLETLNSLFTTKKHENFCNKNAVYFHNFLNHITKMTEKSDTLYSIKINTVVEGYRSNYEYFLEHIKTLKTNKNKAKKFLRKHIFLNNLINYLEKDTDFLIPFMSKLNIFKKYGYMKKRFAYHDMRFNLTFTNPKSFKRCIILFENKDYFSSPCETLAWSLTRGIVYKKKINKNFICWMFNTLKQDFISMRYRPLKIKEVNQSQFVKTYLENAGMIIPSMYLYFYFKLRLSLNLNKKRSG